MSPLDLVIVVLYLAGTTLLGAYFSRQQRSLQAYFVGDRNVSWWLVLISIVATETSTVTFLSVPGLAYAPQGNLTFLQLALGYVIGRCFVAWLLLPGYFQGELLTAYQLLQRRFGPGVQRTASGLFLLTRTIADGLRLMLTALLLKAFTGLPIEISVLVMGVCTIIYTYLGGMKAVIWTDLIQFIIYIAGAVIAAGFILSMLPGGIEQFIRLGEQDHKFVMFDLSLDPTQPFTLLTGVVGGAFFTMASHGADQMMVQRYLCSRSLGAARLALVASGVVVWLQFLVFLLIGVGLYILKSHEHLSLLATKDEAFGDFIVKYLPTGVVGLIVAAVLAAAMSTLSSSLNSTANAFVVDFCRPMLCPGARESDYLFVARIMTAFFGLAQMVVALVGFTLQGEQAVVVQVLTVAGFTTGIVLGLFVLGLLPRPVRSVAALCGMLAGFAAVLVVWIPSVLGYRSLAWPWFAPLGAVVTVLVALVIEVVIRANGSSANRGPQPGLEPPG